MSAKQLEHPAPRVTGIDGVCLMLDRGRDFVYGLVRAGEIESYLDGKARKFVIASVDAYIARQVAKSSKLKRSPNPKAQAIEAANP
jgi:hypothetical protein